MRINNFISIAFISAFGLISCSKDNVTSEEGNEQEKSEFRKLASMNIETVEGNNEEIPGSRTAGSINENGKPTHIYYKDYVNLLSLKVTDKIDQSSEGKNYDFNFSKKGYVTHKFNTDGGVNYDVYYSISGETPNPNGSNSGIITLATNVNQDPIDIKLTVFEKSELEKLTKKGDRLLGLQNFDYSVTDPEGPMGSVLYYLTYDPFSKEKLELPDYTNDTKYNFLLDSPKKYEILSSEIEDDYFVSEEILIAATDDFIYVFETSKSSLPGYILLRLYNRNEPDQSHIVDRIKIDMSRLTTLINASLIINDTYPTPNSSADYSYFVENNEALSIANFKEKYSGVDLTNMKCLYATIDGVPSIYDINNRSDYNTSEPCRLILWADGLKVKGPNGSDYNKEPEATQVNMLDSERLFKGLGFKGNSYSVCFKGYILDDELLKFYAKIDGVNILISTEMKFPNHILYLSQNTLHQLTLLVDAKTLGETIAKMKEQQASGASRANSNDFVELRVPSENLIIN